MANENDEDLEVKRMSLRYARDLYKDGKLVELQGWLNRVVDAFPNEAEFWRLLAVTEGTLGNPYAAKECLLKVIELDITEIDSANYITACCHAEDYNEALGLIHSIYFQLNQEAQEIVNQTVLEAVQIGAFQTGDLPPRVRLAIRGRLKIFPENRTKVRLKNALFP